ncbi:hypothetical protein SLEP1_g55843 [Rubroshorea leprosula]|uniref:Terpene synthase metal-binding domain-containing protein n=1 Tax=Rubroshorea leprosula TaxID=152421 RepID=A0AAV5MKG0_9ROSI|nr:hypothetical protein SLEP1_g55843 [Rubroshorea leprosula]
MQQLNKNMNNSNRKLEGCSMTPAVILESISTQVSPQLAEQITRALNRPIRKNFPRLEARHYISLYSRDDHFKSSNGALLRFAKIDFNMLQAFHQKELRSITEWWKKLDFTTKLPFARDRLVECYFWIMDIYFEPKYAVARIFLTKVLILTSVMDDIFDNYGTYDELKLLTKCIERWDISVIDQLPDYMKLFYQALLDIYSEIEKQVAKEGRSYAVHYAKESMKGVAKAYLVESKWREEGYIAPPYFDDCQRLFITPPQASSYVNPLYDEKATADSESSKSLAERIADFAEESNRLYEERMRRLEEKLKGYKSNLPELKTPQPKSEVLMEDLKKCHAAASPGTLKQFCKSQNVTEMPIVNEGQTTLRSESNPMITVGGQESQLQRVVQSQQRHAALEATSTSMPPSHSKSAKTKTSNSPLTPGRHKPTQVQTCQPSINEGPSDGQQKADAATQKPTLWPASWHKSDKVSTSSISTSFETNEHISSALLKKCSRRPCFLNGRSPSKFNYGQWLKVKYPFKVVSLKRGVISNLGGQSSQIEQQRLQDLIANEVHKAIEKEVARFVPLQPDANSSIQSMPP